MIRPRFTRPVYIPLDSPEIEPATTDQLVQACLRGDQRAWDAIVQRHWRRVFNIAYKIVGRREEAEELNQEIFLKL